MLNIGSHLSISKGFYAIGRDALSIGANTFQFFTRNPRGGSARKIDIEVEDGIVKKVHFTGGCNGNTQGVSKLVEGMKVQDVIDRLEGIDCNGRGTSCPAQLAEALKSAL